jgi:hypothetical protein
VAPFFGSIIVIAAARDKALLGMGRVWHPPIGSFSFVADKGSTALGRAKLCSPVVNDPIIACSIFATAALLRAHHSSR